MKQEFSIYLKSLELAQTYVDAIESHISQVESLYCITVDDIFVNMVKDGEQINYNSLWLFCGESIVECKDFIHTVNYDIVRYVNNFMYASVEALNTELSIQNIDENSIVKIYATVGHVGSISCSLSAVGTNCNKCIEVFKRYFIPNIVKM